MDRVACKIFLATVPHLKSRMKTKLDKDVLAELERVANYFNDRADLPL
jgi:hypothetical protein